jgi:hypothetical protein
LREAAQRNCECGYVALEIVRKIESLHRPLTYTKAKDTHGALFGHDAARLREMNALLGKYEIDDCGHRPPSDDYQRYLHKDDGSPNPHTLDIGDIRHIADVEHPIRRLLASTRIGTWDDVRGDLLTWGDGTNAAETFSCLVQAAHLDAVGRYDYHFFVIHAYRGDALPRVAPAGAKCACVDLDCICKGACEANCEPSVEIAGPGLVRMDLAFRHATTRCVSCRKHFIDGVRRSRRPSERGLIRALAEERARARSEERVVKRRGR